MNWGPVLFSRALTLLAALCAWQFAEWRGVRLVVSTLSPVDAEAARRLPVRRRIPTLRRDADGLRGRSPAAEDLRQQQQPARNRVRHFVR
jgi:hypothetical protein